MLDVASQGGDTAGMEPERRWRTLPDPVRLEDTREVHDVEAVPDPLQGQDTERDFMLRYGAG